MSEVTKLALTAFSTAATGAVLFVFGQILQRFILEPMQEQARTIGKVAYALLAYCDLRPEMGRPDKLEEASRSVRELAAQLRASLRVIPFYDVWARLHFVLPRKNVLTAIQQLIAWSNKIFEGETQNQRQRVSDELRIVTLDISVPPTDEDETTDCQEDEVSLCTVLCKGGT